MPLKTEVFSFIIKTFGCQMNQADAERFSAFLVERGGILSNKNQSDLIVFVSCGVRQTAEQKAISLIKKIKQDQPETHLILTGCLAHRPDVRKTLNDIVDIFIPAGRLGDFQHEIEKIIQKKGKAFENFYSLKPLREEPFRAFIPIMTGCNNFCAYCVVPFARGREISRSPENIIGETKEAIENGGKEIFLLGQNVNSYKGLDRNGQKWDFPDLIRRINDLKGDFWIKFISSHPKDVTSKLISAMRDCQKVSSNLHLPIQAGSDKILSLMNRKYTVERYLKIIAMAKKIHPEIVISSDIIVGFPGETLKDFEQSKKIIEKVRFEMLYSLKYSKRPETAAGRLKETVDALEKKRRQQELDQLWKKISVQNNQKFLGKKIKFIVNSIKEKGDGLIILGKSFEEKTICAIEKKIDNKISKGDWAWARIESVGPLSLTGRIVKK